MKVKELRNGYVKLTAENGIVDTFGNWYSEVVCKENKVRQYSEA